MSIESGRDRRPMGGGHEGGPASADGDTLEDLAALIDRLRDRGVRYLFGAYVDIHGVPKSKCVPVGHLERMARGSELYTVGALEGMGELGPQEDECEGIPDLGRLEVLPWDRRYAIAPADLRFHGEPYSHDSRHVLKRQLAVAREAGYAVNVGIEPEVYVLRKVDDRYEPWIQEDMHNQPTRGYDLEATVLADGFLEPMVEYLNEMGWDVGSFDHEGGDGQYEFDGAYTDALSMCDRMIPFRLAAKHVARELGCIATFMPKPFPDGFGSGAHINISLSDAANENAFDVGVSDGTGRWAGYSELAYQFTAGVLRHAGAITAVACPTVNSYKRLLPHGYMNSITWAPVYCGYGENNRTLMCRLPANRHCVELRIADSACNFYLTTAITLAAGLEGIRERLDPGEPINVDTYTVGEDELTAAGVHRLPRTLGDALEGFEADDLARSVFGEEFHATFLRSKREEWETYNTVISEWELEKYLHMW
jgi:glutamine synthetase